MISALPRDTAQASGASAPAKETISVHNEDFWRQQLNGLKTPTRLPRSLESEITEPRLGQQLRHPVSVTRSGDPSLTAFFETHDLGSEVLYLAAWSLLLSIYSGEEKVLFAVRSNLFSGQTASNHWPMAVPLPYGQITLQWLKDLREQFNIVRPQSPLENQHAFTSLFPLEGWESVLDLTRGSENETRNLNRTVPIEILCQSENGLGFEIIYDPRLFSSKRIERLVGHLSTLLQSLISQAGDPVSALKVLTEDERGQIMVEWNQTHKKYPATTLKRMFEEQAQKTPEAVALSFPGERGGAPDELSYAELNSKANQLAHHLQSLGVGPDVVAGICMERSLESMIAVLGVIKAGGAYVPLDPAYPKDRLSFMLEDTRAPVILSQKKFAPLLPTETSHLILLDEAEEIFARDSKANLSVATTADHLTYLIYTSGSTGKPKGVAMRQGSLVNLLQWQFENWTARPQAKTLQFASLNFDVSFQEIFSTWISGGTLVVITEEVRRDSRALIRFLERHEIERLFLPFVALKHLAEAAEIENRVPLHLKEVITAGEQLQITPQVVRLFKNLSNADLHNQYGPSETHVVTAFRLSGNPGDWPQLPCIGRPIANTTTYILNEHRKPVPAGVAGELFLGGDCLARGYLNRPELTAEKFIKNPFSKESQARLYKTGDLARYLPDGNIEFLGRIDHQVKIRGYRIELGEIETVLSQSPSVRENVVVAREWNGGDKRLVAYVVAHPGQILQASQLQNFLREKLPPYMVPTAFVVLPALPLTPNGKVDRKALPDPTGEEESSCEGVKAPADNLQVQLKLVFERFLNRRPIGVDVSFFELGGDSLQALQLIVEIERATGKKLPLGILYRASTVEALAKAIQEDCESEEFSSLVALHPKGNRPPLFLVHTTPGDVFGYGNLMYHIDPDQPCYGFQSLGLHKEELSHTRLETMAAYYIQLMRKSQPHGPYYLAGWCYGGMVAVEMAHQIQAAGETIAFLGLFETPAPPPNSLTNYKYYLHRLGCLLRMGPRRGLRYLQAKFKYYSKAKKEDDMRFARNEDLDSASRSRLLARLEHVYRTNMVALNFYRSRPYPGKVTLFNGVEYDPAVIDDPLYRWPGLSKDIESHVIPGGHDTILMEPHVKVLAHILQQCLHQAQASSLPRTELKIQTPQEVKAA